MTRHPPEDTGSVTPLIIGMMLCLLLLGAGVTAAGSAFLAGQRLQHLCDGAAATAADTPDAVLHNTGPGITDAVDHYLAIRGPDVTPHISTGPETITVTCDNDPPIMFGALFGSATIHRSTTATAHTTYHQN